MRLIVWRTDSWIGVITLLPPPLIDAFLEHVNFLVHPGCQPPLSRVRSRTRIVTIGPVFLLGLLSITFSLGARSETSSCWNPSNAIGSIKNGVTTFTALTWNDRKSINVRGQTVGTGKKNKMEVGDKRGESRRTHPGGMSSMIMAPESGEFEMKVDEIATASNRLDEGSSVVAATHSDTSAGASSSEGRVQSVNEKEGNRNRAHPLSASRAFSTKRGSIWSVWKDGPGDNAHLEQV